MKKRTGKMISLSLAVALAMTAAPVTVMAEENVTASIQTTDAEKNQDGKTNNEATAESIENSDLENGKAAESEKMEEMISSSNALTAITANESEKTVEENVVEVDGTAYTSLQEAIQNISDGATVKLLEDIALDPLESGKDELNPLMTIDKDITLD